MRVPLFCVQKARIYPVEKLYFEKLRTKGYMLPYAADGRKLVKCGISFSTEPRTIEDWAIVETPGKA